MAGAISSPEKLEVVDPFSPEETDLLVSEFDDEKIAREEFQQWLGSLTLENQVEMPDGSVTLQSNLRKAVEGDVEAMAMVEANIAATCSEVVFKAIHVRKVEAEYDDSGEIYQYGQSMGEVQKNALTKRPNRHPILKEITLVEALNHHRIKQALRSGKLQDHYFVAVSIVPSGVPEKELGAEGDGYFLSDLTYSVQATTGNRGGLADIETGFMPGVVNGEDLEFSDKLNQRIDLSALGRLYEKRGLKAPTTALELLNSPLMIPIEEMPNGVIDFMRLIDDSVAEDQGRLNDRGDQYYRGLQELSAVKEISIAPMTQRVKDRLLSLATQLQKPEEAIRSLWRITREEALKEVETNLLLSSDIFGPKAKPLIEEIRRRLMANNSRAEVGFLRGAINFLAEATGCGGGFPPEVSSLALLYGSDENGPLAFVCKCGFLNIRKPGKGNFLTNCGGCQASVKCD